MAYSIVQTNGEILATIEDGTADNSTTSLTLTGKNFIGYGQNLNNNFVHLLENFSNAAEPVSPLLGQLWYDSANHALKVWNSTTWISVSIPLDNSVTTIKLVDGNVTLAKLDPAILTGVRAGTVAHATSLAGGTAGQVPYQSAVGTTSFYGPGTAGQIAVSGGTSSPQYTSSPQVTSLGVGTAASGTSGDIRATGDITAYYSDDRLKTRGHNIQDALSKVCQLNGFHYTANSVAESLGYAVRPEVGVSAQEVQAVLPEIVVPAPIDAEYLTVHYERLIPLLIEAIKELKDEVDALKKNS
jgi:Chaperone of endosialidase